MKSTRAAGRYSKALLELAIEQKNLEQVKDDALVILEAIKSSRDLRNLLASPIVKPLKKQELLSQIFDAHISSLTAHFIKLVVKQGRDNAIEQVFAEFMNQYREHKNILEATFKTSTKVPASTIAKIKEKLEKATGKHLEIAEAVDPSLIGGFIVDMKNYRMDASLSGGMNKLKKELSK